MTLALFEKTDFSGTVHPLWHDLHSVFHSTRPVHAAPADAKAAIAKYGIFQVDVVTLEERRILQNRPKKLHIKKNRSKISHVSTLFKNSNFCPKIQFWQIPNFFMSFSPQIFLTIFLVKSKLSRAKKFKTKTFSRVFHTQKSDNFLGKSKVDFWTKMKISNSVLFKYWR